MINRVTGEIHFRGGLHIVPHCLVHSLTVSAEDLYPIRTQKLSLQNWKRHVLGRHISEHGPFEVEALSAEDDRILVVMLAHRHSFYEPHTPDDADRRAFHEGVVGSDLAGQKEFTWGEVIHRLEQAANKDWLVIAYSREAKMPLRMSEVLLDLYARGRNEDHN